MVWSVSCLTRWFPASAGLPVRPMHAMKRIRREREKGRIHRDCWHFLFNFDKLWRTSCAWRSWPLRKRRTGGEPVNEASAARWLFYAVRSCWARFGCPKNEAWFFIYLLFSSVEQNVENINLEWNKSNMCSKDQVHGPWRSNNIMQDSCRSS